MWWHLLKKWLLIILKKELISLLYINLIKASHLLRRFFLPRIIEKPVSCYTIERNMKIITSAILILALSACSKESGKNNTDSISRTASCTCNEDIKADNAVFATNVRLKKEAENYVLIFHCASVLTGTASVSDVNGNNEHCEAMYEVGCVSSDNTRLQLSEDFTYFTDQLLPQPQFFEEVKTDENYYFEFTLGQDKKIKSIAKLNIR